ncbi:hypothetical protein P389DRAFT_77773 [Cystobasidium minutum MCA 4210]|uniref:uncharacterized protein n=1 Tax=Cystobasidium minutum MCA 4210 TaxID=1397322 RepID=UPI0034CDF777|eukprot:jgi/Rhomi1/77773/CE77772_99
MQVDPVGRQPSSGPDRTTAKGKDKTATKTASAGFDPPKMATVLFWCGARIWIRCPHCNGQHHVRFQGYDLSLYRPFCRVPSRSYTFVLPAYFDIDKEQGWLVNLHPRDTPEKAMDRALAIANNTLLSALTVVLGQEYVQAAMPAAEIRRFQHDNATGIYVRAHNGQLPQTGAPTSFFLRCPTSGTIKYMVEAATLPALSEEGTLRTVATLKRGGSYPEIMAISGLGKLDNIPSNVLKNEVDRFQRVCDLMKYLDFQSLPAPDNATAGMAFYATHAEKQLIAYFVHKHVITPEDRARVYTFESRNGQGGRHTSGEAGPSTGTQASEEKTGMNLEVELPPHAIKGATILVSQPMCRDCEVFLKRVNQAFHIQLTVTVSQVTLPDE